MTSREKVRATLSPAALPRAVREALAGEPDLLPIRADGGLLTYVLAPRGRLLCLAVGRPTGSEDHLRSYGVFARTVASVADARAAVWAARSSLEAVE